MALEGQADILGKGCASPIVRCKREGDVDLVPFEGEDDPSYFEQGRFIVVRVAEDGAKAQLGISCRSR